MNCQLLSVYLVSAFQQQFLTFTLWAVTHAGHAKHSEQVLLGLDGDRSSDTSNNLFRHTLADGLAFRARLACGLDGSMYCVNSQVLRMGAFSNLSSTILQILHPSGASRPHIRLF